MMVTRTIDFSKGLTAEQEKMLEEKDKLQEMILKKNNQSNNGMQKIYKDNYIPNNNENKK